jgi:putative transposase
MWKFEVGVMPATTERVSLSNKQKKALKEISVGRKVRLRHNERANIILLSNSGLSDVLVAKELKMNRRTVGIWRRRWLALGEHCAKLDENEEGALYKRNLLNLLDDLPRSGTPGKFTSEEICQIINVACEQPEDSQLPLSHWSLSSLADEVVKRKIVASISTSQLSVFLKSSKPKTPQGKRVDSHSH